MSGYQKITVHNSRLIIHSLSVIYRCWEVQTKSENFETLTNSYQIFILQNIPTI